MAIVEETVQKGPVKIGIGDKSQHRALYEAGADNVMTHLWVRSVALDDEIVLRTSFRPEDQVIMVQPSLLTVAELRQIALTAGAFIVPGHDVVQLPDDAAIRAFRKLKADMPEVERVEKRGAAPKWPQPTDTELTRIVEWWHSDRKRADVVDLVRAMLNADVPSHWVRDQVIKATGSGARKPQ